MSSRRLGGRVAIVTGAASGIGHAAVERFCAEGASVLAVDLKVPDDLPRTAAPFVGDLTDPATAVATVDAAVDHFGRLDVLYSNAGVVTQSPVAEVDDATWDRMVAINLTAQFTMVRAVSPALQASGGGAIILTTSEMVFSAARHMSAYIAAKSGVVGLVRALAAEFGVHGIRVNAIAPGPTATPMMRAWLDAAPDADALLREQLQPIALGRLATPSEIAAAGAFLASDDASFVTGHTLIVDGGVTAWSGS